jgi:hypothetical protein
MAARDWMLVYAEREVQPVLASAPALDRDATWVLVRRLYSSALQILVSHTHRTRPGDPTDEASIAVTHCNH